MNIKLNIQAAFAHTCLTIMCLASSAHADDDPVPPPDTAAPATDAPSNDGVADPDAAAHAVEPHGPPGPHVGPASPGKFPAGGPPGLPLGMVLVSPAARVDFATDLSKPDHPSSTMLAAIGAISKMDENFTVLVAIAGSYDARDASGAVSFMDVLIQYEPMPELNLWLGRMVDAVDRSSLSGPPFVATWYFPGFGYIDGQFPLPHVGFLGRLNGATVWGNLFGGHLKYYASMMDVVNPGESPLFSGRINLSLLSPEPGYYNSSSYFGKDILAIGVGGQSKNNGSVNPMTQQKSDYSLIGADLFFEKDLGHAGVFDIEGSYSKFNGDFERTSWSWFGLASYLLPGRIAGSQIQPLVRMQQAIPTAPGAPTSTLIDAQVSLYVDGFFNHVALGYRRAYAGPLEASTVFIGLSLLKL